MQKFDGPMGVFLASPSDVAEFKRIAGEEIGSFEHSEGQNLFRVIGWEDVPGGVGRPQSLINEKLDQCDYLIVIFGGTWGSPTKGFWEFTSGTEEELFRGLANLGNDSKRMRDVFVIFVNTGEREEPVRDLIAKIQNSASLLYEEVDDELSFSRKIRRRVESWVASDFKRVNTRVEMLPSSGKDYLGAQWLRAAGISKINLGFKAQGLESLRSAADQGGYHEMLLYAKHLYRQGYRDRAIQILNEAVEKLRVQTLESEEAVALIYAEIARINVEENRAVTRVKLQEALRMLPGTSVESDLASAKILDYLGHNAMATENYEMARKHFCDAYEIRKNNRGIHSDGIHFSEINLGRLALRQNDLDECLKHVHNSMEKREQIHDIELRATLMGLAAECYKARDDYERGITCAEECRDYNRHTGHKRGEAIAHKTLAELYKLSGKPDLALTHARESLRLNQKIGATEGVRIVREFLQTFPTASNLDSDSIKRGPDHGGK